MSDPQTSRFKLFTFQSFLFATACWILVVLLLLLRFASVTGYLYRNAYKDPERKVPEGRVLVAPADGTVLYVKRVKDGVIPEVVKRGVSVPIADHLKTNPVRPMKDGFLIGIFMDTYAVHINRAPDRGVVRKEILYNGPHMNMTRTETKVLLAQFVPGWTAVKKWLGLPPYRIEKESDYILKSARETLVLEDERGSPIYVVRIAGYYVGKILTWVRENESVARGQKLGMITWGSQTDVLFEAGPETAIQVQPGDRVYAGESILARY